MERRHSKLLVNRFSFIAICCISSCLLIIFFGCEKKRLVEICKHRVCLNSTDLNLYYAFGEIPVLLRPSSIINDNRFKVGYCYKFLETDYKPVSWDIHFFDYFDSTCIIIRKERVNSFTEFNKLIKSLQYRQKNLRADSIHLHRVSNKHFSIITYWNTFTKIEQPNKDGYAYGIFINDFDQNKSYEFDYNYSLRYNTIYTLNDVKSILRENTEMVYDFLLNNNNKAARVN